MKFNTLKIALLLLSCGYASMMVPSEHSKEFLAALHEAKTGDTKPLLELINARDFQPGDSTETEDGNIIHMVASHGLTTVLKVLIEKGFDLNSETSSGKTPLMLATLYKQTETEKMLKQALDKRNRTTRTSGVKTAMQALYKKRTSPKEQRAHTRLSVSDEGSSSGITRSVSDDADHILAPQPRRGRGRGSIMRVPSPLMRDTSSV